MDHPWQPLSRRPPRARVLFGPSLAVWQGSGGTVVERNVFINTTREIVLGLDDRTPNQHTGGIVRNNMIVRNLSTADATMFIAPA